MKRILVLNPNSSEAVTASMQEAVGAIGQEFGTEILFRTLASGPSGIETQAHVESVVLPVAEYFRSSPADAYVIGCFSDPGLHLSREVVSEPVLGIAESAFLSAVGINRRFGIVAMKERAIQRHMRIIRQMGFEAHCAGDRAIDVAVSDLEGASGVLDRIVESGKILRDVDGAGVLVLGCSGMGKFRSEIEERLEIPVVDPTQAAVWRAIGLLKFGYRHVA